MGALRIRRRVAWACALAALAACGRASAPAAPPPKSCQSTENAVFAVFQGASAGCTVDADCVAFDVEVSCFSTCPVAVLASRARSIRKTLDGMDTSICGTVRCETGAQCSGIATAICSQGTCELGFPDAGFIPPPGFQGYLHELGISAALNLQLSGSGKYEAVLSQCNLQEGFAGGWVTDDATTVTLVDGDRSTNLSLRDGGELQGDVPFFLDVDGGERFAPGAVCAVCDGGAATALVPCETPNGF